MDLACLVSLLLQSRCARSERPDSGTQGSGNNHLSSLRWNDFFLLSLKDWFLWSAYQNSGFSKLSSMLGAWFRASQELGDSSRCLISVRSPSPAKPDSYLRRRAERKLILFVRDVLHVGMLVGWLLCVLPSGMACTVGENSTMYSQMERRQSISRFHIDLFSGGSGSNLWQGSRTRLHRGW